MRMQPIQAEKKMDHEQEEGIPIIKRNRTHETNKQKKNEAVDTKATE